MSDLISRKEVINLLCGLHIDNIAVNDKRVTDYIRELPTAYDVDKVVEQLDKLSNDVISTHFAYECDDHEGIYSYGLSDGYDKAIDIVRAGGKE